MIVTIIIIIIVITTNTSTGVINGESERPYFLSYLCNFEDDYTYTTKNIKYKEL